MAGANLTDAGLLGAALQAFQNGRAQRQQQNYQRAQMGAMQAYKAQQAQTAADRVKFYGQHVTDQATHLQNADALGLKKFSQTGDAAYDRAYNQLVIANGRGELSDEGLVNGVQQLGRPTAANPTGIAPGTVTPGAGPNALASNGLKGAQADAIGVKNLTGVYNTVSGLPGPQQAPYLHGVETGDPNIKLQIPMETVIGQQSLPVAGPPTLPMIQQGQALPDMQQDVLAPYYQPNMKDQSSIDRANATTLTLKHRLPLIDSLAALQRVKAANQNDLDQSIIGLRGKQGKFFDSHTANMDLNTKLAPDLAGSLIDSREAGAAAARARAAASAGGVNGDDKFGLALNSKKAAIAMQLMRASNPKVDPLTGAITPPMSESNPEAYQALQNSYKAVNDQLAAHIQGRNRAPQGGGGQSGPMQHSGMSGQSTDGLTGSVTVPGGHTYGNLHPEFANGLTSLMAAAQKAGIPLGMTDGYRSYAQQVDAYRRKPTLAAKPGTSNHGWGTAADLSMADGSPISAQAAAWVRQHAAQFGLNIPMTGGPGHKSEPWHVELAKGGGRAPRNSGGSVTAASRDRGKPTAQGNAQMMNEMASAPAPKVVKLRSGVTARRL